MPKGISSVLPTIRELSHGGWNRKWLLLRRFDDPYPMERRPCFPLFVRLTTGLSRFLNANRFASPSLVCEIQRSVRERPGIPGQ